MGECGSKTESVVTVGVYMHLDWDILFAERGRHHTGVLNRNDGILKGVPDEHGGHILADGGGTRHLAHKLGRRILAQ